MFALTIPTLGFVCSFKFAFVMTLDIYPKHMWLKGHKEANILGGGGALHIFPIWSCSSGLGLTRVFVQAEENNPMEKARG